MRAVVMTAAIALLLSGGATAATEAPASARLGDSQTVGQADANQPIDREDECRFKNVGTKAWSSRDVERTIRCVATKEDVDASQALSVWRCESGWAYEPAHSDCCHGPMQYMVDTFRSQFHRLQDAIHRRYGAVAGRIHNVRANITTAIVFVGHGGAWSPTWECA